MTRTEPAVSALLERLERSLGKHAPLAVAASGGVDSMTLAYIAHRADPRTEIYHALSPAVPVSATERVKRHAQAHGWNLRLIDAGEMRDPDYLRNPADRCYFCKSNLYRSVLRHAAGKVASGTNTDDLGDYRPGLRAAAEQGVVHPLVEAGIDKAGVRALARAFGLSDLQELPASPCLSSRVTTGIAIDAALLPLIDEVESGIRALLSAERALEAVRCRIRADHVAIQLDAGIIMDAKVKYEEGIRALARVAFAKGGFAHLAARIEIEPYRRGSAFIHLVNDER